MRDGRLLTGYRSDKYKKLYCFVLNFMKMCFSLLICIVVLDEWKNVKLVNLNLI